MIYCKGIFFTVLNLCILFFQCTAFGLYSPTSDSIESDINFNFEPQAFSEANGDETYTPVLLLNDNGNYCVIPLNEQNRKKLNTEEILEQNPPEQASAFEQMKGLKPCQPEITQIALNSIDKQANQLAIAQAVVVGGAIYLGACSAADYMSNKRYEVVGHLFSDRVSAGERVARWMVSMVCFPMYIVGVFIRGSYHSPNKNLVIRF